VPCWFFVSWVGKIPGMVRATLDLSSQLGGYMISKPRQTFFIQVWINLRLLQSWVTWPRELKAYQRIDQHQDYEESTFLLQRTSFWSLWCFARLHHFSSNNVFFGNFVPSPPLHFFILIFCHKHVKRNCYSIVFDISACERIAEPLGLSSLLKYYRFYSIWNKNQNDIYNKWVFSWLKVRWKVKFFLI